MPDDSGIGVVALQAGKQTMFITRAQYKVDRKEQLSRNQREDGDRERSPRRDTKVDAPKLPYSEKYELLACGDGGDCGYLDSTEARHGSKCKVHCVPV